MSTNPVFAEQHALMIIDPLKSIEDAKNRRSIVVTMRERSILKEGVDFGIVPGSTKPTLLKPGAERLCAAFGFNPQFEVLDKVERWDEDRPLFFYQIVCHLIHIDSGSEVATGVGSCNSMESKYRWRWVPEGDVPPDLDKSRLLSRQGAISEFAFAIEKAETSGQYGKPAAYWQAFKDAINNRTARSITRKTSKGNELPAWEIGGLTFRIPNDDVFSLVNTVVKMACKRALVAAALIGANASEFFTQDVEDMPGFGIVEDVVIDAAFTVVEPAKSVAEPSAGVRGAGITGVTNVQKPGSFEERQPTEEEDAMRPDQTKVDLNLYVCDVLKVHETKTTVQFLLMVKRSATNILVKDMAAFDGLTLNDMPVVSLRHGVYPLEPAWSVRADSLPDGSWHVLGIQTAIPV